MSAGLVYLDHNATTPVWPEVIAEMTDTLQRVWANPSSTHGPGQAARRLLADARARVAAFLGCQGSELVFTSGATEANHAALLGALALQRNAGRRRLVLSAVEHPGLLALAQRLRTEGTPVDLIPVGPDGAPDLQAAHGLVGSDVALVSVMAANNETGVRMPVAELADIAHAAGALFHTDATQAIAKSDFRFAAGRIDLLSASAHKLGGPKGIGALVVRKGLAVPPLLSGRQERNRRGGTENLPGIAGFAAACDQLAPLLPQALPRMAALRDRLQQGLVAALPGTHVYGEGQSRLANTLSLRFGELDSEQVLGKLERAGVVASSGAACTASGTQPSHVLLAMGESVVRAKASVRLSLGFETTEADIDRTLAAAVRAIGPLLGAELQPLPLAA